MNFRSLILLVIGGSIFVSAVAALLDTTPPTGLARSSDSGNPISEAQLDGREPVVRPTSQHRVYLPYWRTDAHFDTRIYIRNTHVRTTMKATLSLVGRHGRLKLPEVEIQKAQTFSIDVEEAFRRSSIAQSEEGSAFIDFLSESTGAINAFAQIINPSESIALSFPFQESGQERKLDAVAWFNDGDTNAFISMYNTSAQEVRVSPILFVGRRPMKLQHVKLKAFEAATIRVPRIEPRKLDEYPFSAGITITHDGVPGALVAQGWASNSNRGFSAGFSFSSLASCDCKPGEKRSLYGTGIPIGPSTKMGGAVFNPLLILRNTAEDDLTVLPIFTFMSGELAKKVVLPSLTLPPQETKLTNLREYQLNGIIPDGIDNGGIELQFESKTGGLIAELTSVDLTGFYSSQVPLVCGGKQALHMSYWRTDADWDSILHVQNISEHDGSAEITISYQGGLYVLEKRLRAGELAMISIKELQQTQTPDRNGIKLPLSDTTGGVNIWSKDLNNALVINGTIVNPVTGTCGFCGGFGVVQQYGLTDMPQNCFSTPFREYTVGEVIPLQMFLYFDTGQCGSDAVIGTNTSTPSVVQVTGTDKLTVVGGGMASFSANSQNLWSGPEDPNCTSPYQLSALEELQIIEVRFTLPQSGPVVPLSNGEPPPGSDPFLKSIQISATGTPSGGNFMWTTSSSKVTLTNHMTSTVTVTAVQPSTQVNDISIMLSYKINGQGPTVEIKLTVQKPTTFGFLSQTSLSAGQCPSGQSGIQKTITWEVRDQLNHVMNFALPIFDTITNTTPNSCFVPIQGEGTDPGASTGPGGRWNHRYRLCSTACNGGGQCQVEGTQAFFVNGFQINLSFTMTCTSITVAGH